MIPEITIIMNTARDDYPMIGLDEPFPFSPAIKSLNKQELKNFELIIVDALWNTERKRWIDRHAEFPARYIDARDNRFIKHGLCAIASMKNTGPGKTFAKAILADLAVTVERRPRAEDAVIMQCLDNRHLLRRGGEIRRR